MVRVRLFGLSIDSDLPILGPRTDADADVVIRSRNAGPGENFADYETYVTDDGRIDIQHEGIRYLVSGGEAVEVVVPEAIEEGLVVACLTGVAFGALLLQRGLLPIHANAVRLPNGEGVAAFAGPSGAGKSTVAARLQQAGYDMFCDDLLGVRIKDDEPIAVRGIPRLRLWDDAIEHLGIERQSVRRIIEGVEKFEVPLGSGIDTTDERPLERLYVLEQGDEGSTPSIEAVPGAEAGRAVLDNCYRWRTSAALHGEQWAFDRCLDIARAVDVYRVVRPWSLEREAETFDLIDRHLRA